MKIYNYLVHYATLRENYVELRGIIIIIIIVSRYHLMPVTNIHIYIIKMLMLNF